VTNIISPMMSYFALIIAFLQRYEPKAGIGTVIAVMLPYSIVFLLGWAILFSIWMAAHPRRPAAVGAGVRSHPRHRIRPQPPGPAAVGGNRVQPGQPRASRRDPERA
jgi:hypothetical protein